MMHKICYFSEKKFFYATYSVCSISFHSIPFRKIPIAVYRANVKQTSTILRVLKVHALDEIYIIETMICIYTIGSRCQIK